MRSAAFFLAGVALAAGAPTRGLGQQRTQPFRSPLTVRLVQAWRPPFPSDPALYLYLVATETYPADSACLDVATRDGPVFHVEIRGRIACRPEYASDDELLPYFLSAIPIGDRADREIEIANGPDTVRFLLEFAGDGYRAHVLRPSPRIEVPGGVPLVSPHEAHTSCQEWGKPVSACALYNHALPAKGRLYGGPILQESRAAYPFLPFHVEGETIDSFTLAREAIWGVIDDQSLQRILAFTAEYTDLLTDQRSAVRVQITTGRGQRFICGQGTCEESDLQTSIGGGTLWVLPSSPPALLLGEFVDDAGIELSVTELRWIRRPETMLHIVRWSVGRRYFVAQNDSAAPGGPAGWTRIDWVGLGDASPYTWAYCATAYQAGAIWQAEQVPPADSTMLETGCRGGPFTRVRRRASER